MKFIQSSLEDKVQDYIFAKNELDKLQFSLGGNWDYNGGSFDRILDDHRTMWLRIPFQITQGQFDGEVTETDALIQMGTPYVLRHLYQEGLDGSAEIHTYGALVDQFQEPSNSDAEIGPEWIEQGKVVLKQAEQLLL
ncbi:MAG: YugN family protein [Paenibacillaceae bacterium]